MQRYVKGLTQAMQLELSQYGITVQCVTPLFVVTKMNHYSETVCRGGFLFPDVKTYTRSAVFTLGKTNETTGYWTHALQVLITNFHLSSKAKTLLSLQYAVYKIAPEWIRMRISGWLLFQLKQEYLNTQQKTS